jgi:hypothetical protein
MPGTVLNWSDTSITVGVPTGATRGPLTVTEGGVNSNSVQFSIENLSVSGLSPALGPTGSQVTITGTGFGASQTTSGVTFRGTVANIQSWSDTQIVALVPVGSFSGSVNVTVGGIIFYGPQFTITTTAHLTDSKSNQTVYTFAMPCSMERGCRYK